MNMTAHFKYFDMPFMRKFGIKPFPIDETMQLGGKFMRDLKGSIRKGFDQSRPIVVSTSTKRDLDGRVIDGRHRLVLVAELLAEGHPTKIVVRRENVHSMEDLLLRELHYELLNSHKEDDFTNRHLGQILSKLVAERDHKNPETLLSWLSYMGMNTTPLEEMASAAFRQVTLHNREMSREVRMDDHQSALLHKPATMQQTIQRTIQQNSSKSMKSRPIQKPKDKDNDDVMARMKFKYCPSCKTRLVVVRVGMDFEINVA